jgi:hypothetical protein
MLSKTRLRWNFSVTFREILLDFYLADFARFDCELAQFSGGLCAQHWQDMRFIKAAKEKR